MCCRGRCNSSSYSSTAIFASILLPPTSISSHHSIAPFAKQDIQLLLAVHLARKMDLRARGSAPDSTNDGRAANAEAPDTASLHSNNDGHVGTNEKPSELERTAQEASDQTSDGPTSDRQTSGLEKIEDHDGPPELSNLQAFVVVLAICVGGFVSHWLSC